MNNNVHNVASYGGEQSGSVIGAERNRVLRNTYWLLALSMVPTVLGAWVGMAMGLNRILTPGIGAMVFLGGAFAFMFAIEKFKNSAAGVPVLLGFTFFMGMMLSRMLAVVLGMSNGTSLVMMAFASTGAVFLGMATLASVVKRDLSGIARFMFIGMIVVFDGQCLLCNGWVQFLLRHDRSQRIRFASIQSAVGQQLLARAGLQVEGLQTLLVIDGERSWQHTAAILRVLHALGWPWRLAWVGWLVPAPLRDALYRWVARNRYRIWGRSATCMLPAPEHRARFLEQDANL